MSSSLTVLVITSSTIFFRGNSPLPFSASSCWKASLSLTHCRDKTNTKLGSLQKSKGEMAQSYLGPWRVKVGVGKDMDPGRDLRHELVTVAWPVGNVDHGFGQDMSDYQVEAIVQRNFLLDLLGKLGRALSALFSPKQELL